jgi:hypothetical protein
MQTKKVHVPSAGSGSGIRNGRNKKVSRKRKPSPVRLHALVEEHQQFVVPTLVFTRHYPSLTFPVGPIRTPLYWFDRSMLDKHLILSIPPDTFVVDGRRFKVLAQDQRYIGRRSQYTRWLVYEESAVPKGERP